MSTLVANCPRCRSARITFDVQAEQLVGVEYQWQRYYELACICRACHFFTVFFAKQSDIRSREQFDIPNYLIDYSGSANDYVTVTGHLSLKNEIAEPPPEHLPKPIRAVFVEGATCLAVECNNAAGAMFRVCVDMATRDLVPNGDAEGLTARTRRDLGLRLPWLFDHGLLASDLKELSRCIREDGNDGAHAGTLTQADAEDLLDFTRELLERLYTEPERLKIAEERRKVRRAVKKN